MKLNSDGSSMGNPGVAGEGGVIRNHNGKWIRGFSRSIGITTSVIVELWALRDGLKLCIDMHLPVVIVELNALLVVDMINGNLTFSLCLSPLVDDCRALLS